MKMYLGLLFRWDCRNVTCSKTYLIVHLLCMSIES